jgi:hypothetical protein
MLRNGSPEAVCLSLAWLLGIDIGSMFGRPVRTVERCLATSRRQLAEAEHPAMESTRCQWSRRMLMMSLILIVLSVVPASSKYSESREGPSMHTSRLTFELGFVDVDFSLVLRLGGCSSPFGSIDLMARNSLDSTAPLCGVSIAFFTPFPPLDRFMAGGLAGTGSAFAGVVVERKDTGSMDDAEGMKAEIRFGRGRRVGAGTEGCPISAGKVVSPTTEGVL